MKRIFATLALVCVTVFAFGQNSSILRPRVEIAEASSEEHGTDMEVFYMNDESPRTYYLSLGNLGIGGDIVQLDFDPVFELFIPLGGNVEEAIAKMEEIKALYKMPRFSQTEITGSFAALYPTGEPVTVTVTSRRFLLSKVLEFSLPVQGSDSLVRATHIYRSDFNSLLTTLKIYRKLHPKE
ncbi:MAG: hypothetical protein IK011_03250 [Bacteroidaceae bacterium]|nr:hypothetical protein [Bacteroidaceae bacterium]